ncbi:MAG: alpha/beta fold hydrolase [Anaerolinea sp.]|nr:alpha/beta fold hydrolase [Anaerolinea sp.]
METIFVETEFGKVHGKAAGNRSDPLVLGLHGWSQRNGWHTWEPLLPPLADAGFYVVSVDMPGWGQSVPAKPEPLTNGALSNGRYLDAVLAILDGLTSGQTILMGKSWGGGLAINLALTYPQRVSKLILTAPAFRELERLAQLAQPTLLAWAEDDPVIPFSYAAQFAAAIPNCQLATYPTGGHSAAQKNAADFAPRAIEFLRET